jgi:hypothetical protein
VIFFKNLLFNELRAVHRQEVFFYTPGHKDMHAC